MSVDVSTYWRDTVQLQRPDEEAAAAEPLNKPGKAGQQATTVLEDEDEEEGTETQPSLEAKAAKTAEEKEVKSLCFSIIFVVVVIVVIIHPSIYLSIYLSLYYQSLSTIHQ